MALKALLLRFRRVCCAPAHRQAIAPPCR